MSYIPVGPPPIAEAALLRLAVGQQLPRALFGQRNADGQPARALTIVLDVEPLAVEANQLLQGLATLCRIAREDQDEAAP